MKYRTGGKPRYAHQKRGLKDIIRNKGQHALIFDPGCGKTATALDYAALLALKLPARHAKVLVVAPVAATDTWVIQAPVWSSPDVNVWAEVLGGSRAQKAETLAERGGKPFKKPSVDTSLATYERALRKPGMLHLKKSVAVACREDGVTLTDDEARKMTVTHFLPSDSSLPLLHIAVCNIETFGSRATMRGGAKRIDMFLREAVERFNPDLLIIDESHKLKSPTGVASSVIHKVAREIPRRLLLTGTLMPHSPLDVWSQWRILDEMIFTDSPPGSVVIRNKPISYGTFRQRYSVSGGFGGHETLGFRNLDHLQTKIAEHSTIVKKEDALDLPKTTDVVVPVHLSPRELRAYESMKKDLQAEILAEEGEVQTVTALSQLTKRLRLRQITAGHLPTDDPDSTELEVVGTSKIDTIAEIVNVSLEGENRVVIFGVFIHEIEALAKALSIPGTTIQKISGATPQAQRIAYRQAFGDTAAHPERIVMVAQVSTMSVSVNELVTASHAVFASLSERRDDLIQAKDRLNRIGQKRPVTFWFALAPHTVDELILESHQNMTNLEGAILAHLKE